MFYGSNHNRAKQFQTHFEHFRIAHLTSLIIIKPNDSMYKYRRIHIQTQHEGDIIKDYAHK